MKPRASFVIPAYNAERWIAKAVNSCLNQSVKQIEVVVVNDGSTDMTQAIIDKIAKDDKRLFPIELMKNVGRSEARNIGNKNVSSELIMVLDADDMSMRNRAKDTLAFFEHRKPDVSWGSFFEIDAIGNIRSKIGCMAFDKELFRQKKLNFICHSTMAYRKGVTLNVQYDTGEYSKLGLDDWKFQWDCVQKGYLLKHIKTPLSYYRSTKSGISSTRDPKAVEAQKDAYFNVAV